MQILMHHNRHQVIKVIVVYDIFNQQAQPTVRWGNREPWKEETFWSNARMQPELTDSHLGTTRAPTQEVYKHISEYIRPVENMCKTEVNQKILEPNVPSVCELVISLSSPVKPPSLLKWTERRASIFVCDRCGTNYWYHNSIICDALLKYSFNSLANYSYFSMY